MNKILTTLAALMVCALAGLQAAAEEALIVHFTDGSVTSFVLSKKPRVAFGETSLNVVAEELKADFPIASVRKFSFGEHVSIAEVAQRECRFVWADRDHVTAHGMAAGEPVTLTAIDGKRAATLTADADGSVAIDLTALPAGVYVVSSPSIHSFKIMH